MKNFFMTFLILMLFAGCNRTTSRVQKDDKIQKLREYEEAEVQTGPKRRIVVGKIKNETRFGNKRMGDIAKDVLISEFSKTNRFVVLEREDLDSVMEETEFSNVLGQGSISGEQQFLDAEYVIVGSVTKYAVNTTGTSKIISKSKEQKAEVAIDIKVIDVRTGKIWSELGEGNSTVKYGTTFGVGTSGGYDESLEQEAFRAATIDAMENIIERIDKTPWSAKVAKTYSNKIIINAGKLSNLEINTKLDVFKQGEKIEFQGEFLGYMEEKIGTAKVIDYMGEDAAIASFDGQSFTLPAVVKMKR